MSNTSMALADLERLLGVYGGDRSRWPADARAAAAQLVARDAKARRVLAEAEALDRVLERAPLPALAAEAGLADRIVAAAHRSPRMVRIALAEAVAEAESAETPVSAVPQRRSPGPRRAGAEVRAAGLLAAALVAGVVVGLSNLPQRVLPVLADFTSAKPDSYNLAHADPFDEDVL